MTDNGNSAGNVGFFPMLLNWADDRPDHLLIGRDESKNLQRQLTWRPRILTDVAGAGIPKIALPMRWEFASSWRQEFAWSCEQMDVLPITIDRSDLINLVSAVDELALAPGVTKPELEIGPSTF